MPTSVSQLFAATSSSVRARSIVSTSIATSHDLNGSLAGAGILGSVIKVADDDLEGDFSSAFYCDACEKGFNSHSAFATHKSSHVSCSFPGCKFVGSRRVVADHVSGYHKSRSHQSSQEVSAYIEARKKKYPTDANVLLKQQHLKNCLQPGRVSCDRGYPSKKRNTLPDPAAPDDVSSSGQPISSQAPMMPSLASLCSYDDDSDYFECVASKSTSVLNHVQRVESKPVVQSDTVKPRFASGACARSNSGTFCSSAFPNPQSKVLARTDRCNLLEKLLQKEAIADVRLILFCFRAFASRGLV